MTTNLFIIANVKHLRTDGSFRMLQPFFQTSSGIGVLNSAIFNSFHNRVEFGTVLEGLRNFGGGGGLNPQIPPLGTPLCVCGLVYPAHKTHTTYYILIYDLFRSTFHHIVS